MSWTSAAQTQVPGRLPTPLGRVAPRRAWPAIRQITRESPGDGAPPQDPQTSTTREDPVRAPPASSCPSPTPSPATALLPAPASRSPTMPSAAVSSRGGSTPDRQLRRQKRADWQPGQLWAPAHQQPAPSPRRPACRWPGCPVLDRHQRAGPPPAARPPPAESRHTHLGPPTHPPKPYHCVSKRLTGRFQAHLSLSEPSQQPVFQRDEVSVIWVSLAVGRPATKRADL